MDAQCLHEAGHAVVLKHLLGRVPTRVTLPVPGEDAQVAASVGWPSNGHEATRFAAYFAAGRAAVLEGKCRSVLLTDVNVDDGYLGRPQSGADSDLIDRLVTEYGAARPEANQLARQAIKIYWPTVETIASELEITGLIGEDRIHALLSSVPSATS